jgi:Cohesin domain
MKLMMRYRQALGLVAALGCLLVTPVSATPLLALQYSISGNVLQAEVTGTGLSDLYAYQFTLNFNPAVLHATSVGEGSFLSAGGSTFFDPWTTDNVAGSVSFVFDTLLGPTAGVNGNGILAIADFAIQQFHTTTTLNLSDVILLNSGLNEIAVQTQALTATIPEPAPAALLFIGIIAMVLVALPRKRGDLAVSSV